MSQRETMDKKMDLVRIPDAHADACAVIIIHKILMKETARTPSDEILPLLAFYILIVQA
jgi:hypothetical protein